jgi:DNA-binding IclR family transcriptional regulator
MALLPHLNSKTRMAWPSLQTLASLTNREPSTVWRAVQKLEALGLLEVQRGRGRNKANRYFLKLGSMEIDASSRRRKTLRIRKENTANSKTKVCEFEGGTYDDR